MIVNSYNNPKYSRVGGQNTPSLLPPQGKICDLVGPTVLKQSLSGDQLQELRKRSQASIQRNENIRGWTPAVLGIVGALTAGVLGATAGGGIGVSLAGEAIMGSFASGLVGGLAGAASTFIVQHGFFGKREDDDEEAIAKVAATDAMIPGAALAGMVVAGIWGPGAALCGALGGFVGSVAGALLAKTVLVPTANIMTGFPATGPSGRLPE